MATSLRFRGFYDVFCLNMTVIVLANFVRWKCICTLAASLFTEYLNEILTVPEATRLDSPLHSIWGTHALFSQQHPFLSLKLAASFTFTHPPHTSTLITPNGEDWAPTQLSLEIYCIPKSKARNSLCQDNGHGIIQDTLAKQQGVQIQVHTQLWQKTKYWN